MKLLKNKKLSNQIISYSACVLLLVGCGDADSISVPPVDQSSQAVSDVMDALQVGSTSTPTEPLAPTPEPTATPRPTATPEPTPEPSPTPFVPLRDNTPYCPTPEASGTETYGNDVTTIDVSNARDGYIMANYTGTCPKVKLQIIGPGSYKCTYNLNTAEYQAFPLTGGNGSYTITVNENIQDNDYSVSYELNLDVSLTDPFSPYLTPSSYVNYQSHSRAVELAAQLCETATDDLDCVSAVYNYVIENISYDYDKAAQITSGALSSYIADIDGTLSSGKGICLDYAALMACMLRTQHIPTRLEVGYAGLGYHAWISVYIKDTGWVNGIVQFDGSSWSLMDPTFAATNSEDDLKEFIGDGTNYSVRYIY
ncbi:MAG: transglutaminase-like domain-containing protein [bacterium]|nr:transglutaminase-like domain-containing protein [bacterium]